MTSATNATFDLLTSDGDLLAGIGQLDGEGVAEVQSSELSAAIGWELKDEGLCRDSICVPVADRSRLVRAGGVDLAEAARLVNRPLTVDEQTRTVAVGVERSARDESIRDLRAPEFSLPDLDGTPRSFSDWGGVKKLLLAVSSW